MSTERAQVLRNLIIKSPKTLWDVIKFRHEIWVPYPELNEFVYLYDKYSNGCQCDLEENRKNLYQFYQIIKKDNVLISYLADTLKCNQIIFTDEEEI